MSSNPFKRGPGFNVAGPQLNRSPLGMKLRPGAGLTMSAGQVVSPDPLFNPANPVPANPAPSSPDPRSVQIPLFDASGDQIMDANGNPIYQTAQFPQGSDLASMQEPLPATTDIVMTEQPVPVVESPDPRPSMLLGVIATALVVGGAAYVGSYYGSQRANKERSLQKNRSSRA